MAHMIVNNQLPKILSFRGQTLVLDPGENKVDADLFQSLFFGGKKSKQDPTLKWYYEEGALDVTDSDGSEWEPKDVSKKKHPSKELMGPNHRTATSISRRKRKKKVVKDTTKEPEKKPVEPIKPRQLGGGVPGNVDEAKAEIAATSDLETLEKWLARETRSGVVPVLMERIEELSE